MMTTINKLIFTATLRYFQFHFKKRSKIEMKMLLTILGRSGRCTDTDDAAAAAAAATAPAEASNHESRVAGAAQHPAQGGARRPQNADNSTVGQPAARAHPAGQHCLDADLGGRLHQQVRHHQGQAQGGPPRIQADHPRRTTQQTTLAAAANCPTAGHHHLCNAANHRKQVRTFVAYLFKTHYCVSKKHFSYFFN